MEKRTILLLLSFASTSSFFFPIFNWNHYEMTGLNYILSEFTPSYKYLLLFIPLISTLIFLETWYSEYLQLTRRLVWIPLLAFILFFILSSVEEGFGNVLSMSKIGLWLTLLFSILLPLAQRKSPSVYYF